MEGIITMNEKVLFEAKFEKGADIRRDGEKIYRVAACTSHDDDKFRVVTREVAVVQIRNEDGNWHDYYQLGNAEGLEIVSDHRRGCTCASCE